MSDFFRNVGQYWADDNAEFEPALSPEQEMILRQQEQVRSRGY